ncbi:MAG: hypothetical protein U9N46_14195 [Euryarchaeota archaeon]|nr:hypothetical protein [Euryarchaeota archaeon]
MRRLHRLRLQDSTPESMSIPGQRPGLVCHQKEGEDFATSVHNTWMGKVTHIVGKEGEATGKLVGLNEFCGGTESNDALCGKCHAGYGLFENDFSVEKINCLICHAPNYKKTSTGPDTMVMKIRLFGNSRCIDLTNE